MWEQKIEYQEDLDTALEICNRMGFRWQKKNGGPSNTDHSRTRFSTSAVKATMGKLEKLRELVAKWRRQTKKELQSSLEPCM